MDRSQALEELTRPGAVFDFLVVGGGASGLGAALDAASRGHRVALIEQADFAKGTSSRSTKLVHGGVRYLRQGNISLVLEALRERGLLYRNAPHLVHNMSFVIPTYTWWEGPFYGIGMKVYDQLAGKLGLSPSKMLSRDETLEELPTIETEGLVGGVRYYDGQFDDSRLAVNLAQTATRLGAEVVNYVRCTGLLKKDGFVRGVKARDQLTGEDFEVEARCVINAAGVFVDELRQWDTPEAKGMVAVSQGVHLVLPREFLPGDTALMVPETADGRVLFAVPWHDCLVVGTTDTPRPEASLEPRALKDERDFIMEHARKYLRKDPTDEDVLSVFAGLRPLVKAGDGQDTAALSRDHTVLISEAGLLTVTGGKWTTYRKMAEDVIDQGELVAGVDHRRCETRHLQLQGWTQERIAEPNLQVYGCDAHKLRELIEGEPALGEPLHPDLPYQGAEVIHHVREEMARTVEDVLARRTRALLLNARASAAAAPRVAELMAQELGEDAAWQEAQVEAYRALAKGYDYLAPESTAAS